MEFEQIKNLASHITDGYMANILSKKLPNLDARSYTSNYYASYEVILEQLCIKYNITNPEKKEEPGLQSFFK